MQGKYVDANMKDDNIKRQIEELQRKRRELSQKIAVGTRANDNLEEADKDIYLKYVNAEAEAKASEVCPDGKLLLSLWSGRSAWMTAFPN